MADNSVRGPEFSLGDLTGKTLVDTIEQAGAVVIRDCLDRAKVQEMLARAKHVYQQKELEYQRGELRPVARHLFEFGHLSQGDLDRPDAKFVIMTFVLKSDLYRLLSNLWGGRLAFLHKNCLPRRQAPGGTVNDAVPFHQDGSFLETRSVVLNFWIPLVSCGVSAPGLEVVLGNPRALLRGTLEGPASKDYREIELPEDWVVSRWGRDKLWHPVLEQGDVLVFSSFTIHRTYMTPEMTETRISLEARCANPDDAGLQAVRNDLIEVTFKEKAVA